MITVRRFANVKYSAIASLFCCASIVLWPKDAWPQDKAAVAPVATVATNKILDPYIGTQLSLTDSDWPTIIDKVAESVGASIVAFVPKTSDIPTNKEMPLKGDAKEVLGRLARNTGGVWRGTSQSLILAKDFVPEYFSFTTSNEWEKFIDQRPMPKLDAVTLFMGSFTPEQVAKLARGEALKLSELKPDQQQLLIQASLDNPPTNKILPDMIAAGYGLSISINSQAISYWRGELIADLQDDLGVGEEVLKQPPGPFLPSAGLAGLGLEETIQIAKPFLQSKNLTVDKTTLFTLDQISALLRPTLKMPLVISKQLKNERLVISKGQWDAATLVAMLQIATDSEIRPVGNLIVLSPGAVARTHSYLSGTEVQNSLLQMELEWRMIRPVIEKLLLNPASTTVPMTANLILNPQLTFFSQLSPEQKSWLEYELGAPPATLVQSSEASNIEIGFVPSINFKFSLPENPKKTWHWGFTPISEYVWFALKTSAQ